MFARRKSATLLGKSESARISIRNILYIQEVGFEVKSYLIVRDQRVFITAEDKINKHQVSNEHEPSILWVVIVMFRVKNNKATLKLGR